MLTTRYATQEDAELITTHRHEMFLDNGFASEETLAATNTQFEPWVRERLEDGRYLGLLLEDDGRVIAGAGIFFADFPPHWMDPQPVRAYLLNVYTSKESRGQGHAKRLVQALIDECVKRKVPTLVLHASPQGRHIYAKLGFVSTDEMILRVGYHGPD